MEALLYILQIYSKQDELRCVLLSCKLNFRLVQGRRKQQDLLPGCLGPENMKKGGMIATFFVPRYAADSY